MEEVQIQYRLNNSDDLHVNISVCSCLQEGANINKSLTTLGKVISALAEVVRFFFFSFTLVIIKILKYHEQIKAAVTNSYFVPFKITNLHFSHNFQDSAPNKVSDTDSQRERKQIV